MKKLLLVATTLFLVGCQNQKSYSFKVENHYVAVMTSEPQEKTHDMYLAYCVCNANECFVEVPFNDERTKIDLVYTGYIITYTLDTYEKVSNNGWAIL